MYPAIYALLALGTVPVLAVILVLLSPFSPIMGFYGRLLASYLCLLICSTYGVLASIVLRLLGYPGLSQWAVGRAFKHTMSLTTGIRFPIINAEHLTTRPAVFIGNHQTELDVLMLGSIFPPYCSVTAKSSLARVPVLGWFMTLSGTVFIDRADRGKAMTAFESAAKHMKEGRQSVFIFPEGTRSYAKGPEMLPFKKGAFHLAVKAGVPIVPVVTANYAGVLDTSRWIFTAGNVPVVVLPPIPTENLTSADVDELCARTRELMIEALVKITEKARQQGVATPASGQVIAMSASSEGQTMGIGANKKTR